MYFSQIVFIESKHYSQVPEAGSVQPDGARLLGHCEGDQGDPARLPAQPTRLLRQQGAHHLLRSLGHQQRGEGITVNREIFFYFYTTMIHL
jgi:hypothetical protein